MGLFWGCWGKFGGGGRWAAANQSSWTQVVKVLNRAGERQVWHLKLSWKNKFGFAFMKTSTFWSCQPNN